MHSATADNVQKVAVATFTFEEIKHSVDLLWESCCLGKPDERRGKNKTSSYVADLMKKLEELQNKDELPCFVVDSIGLSQLPKFGIEDINEIGLAERIRRVEIKLLRMDDTISEHDADIVHIKERTTHVTVVPALSGVVTPTAPRPPALNPSAPPFLTSTAESRTVPTSRPDVRQSVPTQPPSVPAAKKPDAEEDRLAAQLADQPKSSADKSFERFVGSDSEPTQDAKKKKKKKSVEKSTAAPQQAAKAIDDVSKRTTINGPDAKVSDLTFAELVAAIQNDHPWTVVNNKKKNTHKKTMKSLPKKRISQGTAQCNTRLKAAPAPDRSFFVTGADNGTTDEDISSHLKSFNINVRKSDRVSKTDGRCASYKLTVPATEFKKALRPESWPPGIFYRPYFGERRPRRNTVKKLICD